MKKIFSSIAFLLILLALQSCSLFGPSKGYVYDKDYEPAYNQWIPGHYYEDCSHFSSLSSSSDDEGDDFSQSSSSSCTREWVSGYNQFHQAEYYIYISTCRDVRTAPDAHDCDNGVLYVTKYDYNRYNYGDYVDFSNN